jgi:hypothetical protein
MNWQGALRGAFFYSEEKENTMDRNSQRALSLALLERAYGRGFFIIAAAAS